MIKLLLVAALLVACATAMPMYNLDTVVVRANGTNQTDGDGHEGHNHTKEENKTNSTSNSQAVDCFPGNALVQLEDGTCVPMTNLRVGDRVAVGGNKFSEVFLFTHELMGMHEFISLKLDNQVTLEASQGHLLWVNGVLTEAKAVSVGDRLTTKDGAITTVTQVKNVMREGLFNPQTFHGDIVVNGVIASTYTTAANIKMAHAALSPLRAAFNSLGMGMKWNSAIAEFALGLGNKLMA